MSPTTNASFEAGCIERPEGSGKEAIHKACVNNRNEGRMMARLMLRMAVVRSQLTIFEARLQISTHMYSRIGNQTCLLRAEPPDQEDREYSPGGLGRRTLSSFCTL